MGRGLILDGEAACVVALEPSQSGIELTIVWIERPTRARCARELPDSGRARLIDEVGDSEGPADPAGVVLPSCPRSSWSLCTSARRMSEGAHRIPPGHADLSADGEPRPEFDPHRPPCSGTNPRLLSFGVTVRTIGSWVSNFRDQGEAGLAPTETLEPLLGLGAKVDPRWTEAAVEVMVEHTGPVAALADHGHRPNKRQGRCRFGEGSGIASSRATAFRVLGELESLSDLSLEYEAESRYRRPSRRCLRKTASDPPREYLLMDTTRLDVFALDPFTLRWVQSRVDSRDGLVHPLCRRYWLTPVPTKSVDAKRRFLPRPTARPAGKAVASEYAVWPEHGIPRSVLIDVDAIEGPRSGWRGRRSRLRRS